MVITKDFIEMGINSYIVYRYCELQRNLVRVDDIISLIKYRAMSELLSACMTLSLDEILHKRDGILKIVKMRLFKDFREYGIELIDMQIESIKMTQKLESLIARKATATIEARSSLLTAKNDLEVASLFNEASRIFSENPVSMQLEYFEILKGLGKEKETVLVVPDSIMGDRIKNKDFVKSNK